MYRERTFTEVERFRFIHGGIIARLDKKTKSPATLNDEIISMGWRLVGKAEIQELLDNHKRFLYRQDGYLIGTKEDSIQIITSDNKAGKVKKGDILVPAIEPQENNLQYYNNLIIRYGRIMYRSNVFILAVR